MRAFLTCSMCVIPLDHHLTTPSSQPVPYIVFYAPTFFYNHHKQRRKLCTLHNFRRCIIAFRHSSQFFDPEGQRFESSRSHQEQRCLGAALLFLYEIVWDAARGDSNSPCPPSASRRAKTVLRTVFRARLAESSRSDQKRSLYCSTVTFFILSRLSACQSIF